MLWVYMMYFCMDYLRLRLLLLLLRRRLRRVDLERELLLRLVLRLPEEEDDFDLVFLTAIYPPRCCIRRVSSRLSFIGTSPKLKLPLDLYCCSCCGRS